MDVFNLLKGMNSDRNCVINNSFDDFMHDIGNLSFGLIKELINEKIIYPSGQFITSNVNNY